MQFSRHAKGATYARWSLLFLLEANFLELRETEVQRRRMHLLGTLVNKGRWWVRRVDKGGIIRSVWEELSELPIGAVVTDAYGHVLSRGRNRIHERSGPSGAVFDHKLAHAELNALLSLDHREYDPRACVLWTTTEPCPLCVGAARMSEVGGLRYASREPWGDPQPCSRPCPT